MCGILFSRNIQTKYDLNSLKHRGPDSQQIWEKDGTFLGHVRLSIVDLSPAGNQPFHNENDTIHLICNGEIYNSKELRNQLISKGHKFVSHSDNEVILHGYEEWGTSIVSKLIGMFAFLIWDEVKQEVFAARDHVGIKPLFYSSSSNSFLACSELQTIKNANTQLNPLALAYYLGLGYIPSPHSLYKNYYKIEPGHFVIWNENYGLRDFEYWAPPIELVEPKQDFEELFHTVLKDHLMADVPIGVFLSAGLDSSTITLGLKKLGYSTEALTIGFPKSNKNEAPIAEESAKWLGFPQKTLPFLQDDVIGLINTSNKIYDEPQGYSALLTMVKVCELASKKYKVMLSGDGGDEVFGGYNWYNDINLNFSSINHRKLNKWLYKLTQSKRFLKPNYFETVSDLHRHAWRLFPRFLPEEINTILRDYSINFSDEELLEPLRKYFIKDLPLKRALQRIDLMTFCADSINPKVDRASMAFSMEVRVPFLDKRMIEYGLSLPMVPKFENEPKQILRTYLKGNVPESVLNQPKQGFSAQLFSQDNFDIMRKKIQVSNNSVLNYPKISLSDAKTWLLYNLNVFLNK